MKWMEPEAIKTHKLKRSWKSSFPDLRYFHVILPGFSGEVVCKTVPASMVSSSKTLSHSAVLKLISALGCIPKNNLGEYVRPPF